MQNKNTPLPSLSLLIISLMLAVISLPTQANCIFHNDSDNVMQEVTIPTLKLNSHPDADTVLWDSGVINASITTDILCLSAATIETGYINDKTLVSGIATPYVYKTNMPGIGITIYTSKDMETLVPIQWPRSSERAEAGNVYVEQNYFRVKLIATGEPITSGTLVLYGYEADRTFGSIRQFLLSFNPTLIQVQTDGCDVETKNINVELTPGSGAAINSLSRAGDTTNPVDFNIELLCEPNADYSFTFSGVTADGQQDILALDNAEQTSSAHGVGVQILFHDQAMEFNQTRAIWASATTSHVIVPFQARVIRLASSPLQGGDINATATFEMVYR